MLQSPDYLSARHFHKMWSQINISIRVLVLVGVVSVNCSMRKDSPPTITKIAEPQIATPEIAEYPSMKTPELSMRDATGFIPGSCKPHIKWAHESGSKRKEAATWYPEMEEVTGSKPEHATFADFQREYKCKNIRSSLCNDKGLQFPLTCSFPPCDQCSVVFDDYECPSFCDVPFKKKCRDDKPKRNVMHVSDVKGSKWDACRRMCQTRAIVLGKIGCCEARKNGYCIFYPEGEVISAAKFGDAKAVSCFRNPQC